MKGLWSSWWTLALPPPWLRTPMAIPSASGRVSAPLLGPSFCKIAAHDTVVAVLSGASLILYGFYRGSVGPRRVCFNVAGVYITKLQSATHRACVDATRQAPSRAPRRSGVRCERRRPGRRPLGGRGRGWGRG